MTPATSANAQQELAEAVALLQAAERDYDHLLVVAGDAEVQAAEVKIETLRRKVSRLQRQTGVLSEAERAAQKVRERRAREEADAEMARCRGEAAAAIDSFMEAFREQLLELHALAHEQLAEPLRALEVAREHADRLHGRTRGFIPEKEITIDGYQAARDWLSRRAREEFGGQEPLMEHKHEMAVFGFLERYACAISAEEPRPAA